MGLKQWVPMHPNCNRPRGHGEDYAYDQDDRPRDGGFGPVAFVVGLGLRGPRGRPGDSLELPGPEEMAEYIRRKESGCCGSFDGSITIIHPYSKEKVKMVYGFNYGH